MNTDIFASSDYWLSVDEAARRSGCSKQSVRVRVHTGKITALKRYGQWLINTRSLQAYLLSKRDLEVSSATITSPQEATSCKHGTISS